MLKRIRNSLLFSCASLITAAVSLTAFISIFIKAKPDTATPNGSQSNAFLADKRKASAFYRVFSKVYDLVNPHFYTDSMRNEVAELARINGSSRVLDVGCGTGYTTQAILKRLSTGEVVGIDLTRQQLKKAAVNLMTKKATSSLCWGDAENLPFKDETFDAVVSVGAVEYFPDARRAFKEMARVVKTGGRVILGGPESNWFKKVCLHRIFYTLSAKQAQEFFNQAGLKNVRSVLAGVDTYFGTNTYVMIVFGTK